jgi:hypothetical protein
MAINYKNKTISLAKPSHSLNKLTRKSPYNTRSPKSPLYTPLDVPSLTVNLDVPSPFDNFYNINPCHPILKKRNSLTELVSPSKKGPSVSIVSVEPPDITHLSDNTPVFTPGYFEISPARTLFKAARKGKNKLIQMGNEPKNLSVVKGGFTKPPSSHANFIMELQGAV